MGLFEVMQDISAKEILKTDTGDNRIMGVIVAKVVNNYDQDMPGRVCIEIHTRDTEANVLKWARVAMPSSGPEYGHYFLPEVGDEVLVVFEQGNIERPYIIGCIPKDADKFLKKCADENNQFKKIVSTHGNTIYLEDNKEGDGEKDKIRILTSLEEHFIELDNEKHVIRISDKDKDDMIEMKTESGEMTILASKKLKIKVGDNVELTMNGDNGSVSLKATKFDVQMTNSVKLHGDSGISMDAGTIKVEANAQLKMTSSGAVMIDGTPIKLG